MDPQPRLITDLVIGTGFLCTGVLGPGPSRSARISQGDGRELQARTDRRTQWVPEVRWEEKGGGVGGRRDDEDR